MLEEMQRRVVIKVRQPQVILSFCMEEARGPPLLRILQEPEWCDEKDCFPLPKMDDTRDMLAGAKWFSTLDQKSSCWEVNLYPDNEEKTALSNDQVLWPMQHSK